MKIWFKQILWWRVALPNVLIPVCGIRLGSWTLLLQRTSERKDLRTPRRLCGGWPFWGRTLRCDCSVMFNGYVCLQKLGIPRTFSFTRSSILRGANFNHFFVRHHHDEEWWRMVGGVICLILVYHPYWWLGNSDPQLILVFFRGSKPPTTQALHRSFDFIVYDTVRQSDLENCPWK